MQSMLSSKWTSCSSSLFSSSSQCTSTWPVVQFFQVTLIHGSKNFHCSLLVFLLTALLHWVYLTLHLLALCQSQTHKKWMPKECILHLRTLANRALALSKSCHGASTEQRCSSPVQQSLWALLLMRFVSCWLLDEGWLQMAGLVRCPWHSFDPVVNVELNRFSTIYNIKGAMP